MIPKVIAWDKVNKEMIEDVASIHFKTEMIVTSNLCFYPFKDIELLQSTGLFDKNGKEIYEGYILKGPMDFGPAGWIESIAPVSYHKIYGYQLHYFLLKHTEILGNIYEHRHLLGEE